MADTKSTLVWCQRILTGCVQENELHSLTQKHATYVSDQAVAIERNAETARDSEKKMRAAQKQSEDSEAKLRRAEATILELREELKKENRPHDDLRAKIDELKVSRPYLAFLITFCSG